MNIYTFARTITKSLFRRPATLMYPGRPRAYFQITRGHIENEIDKCIFCGMCARRCPADAIIVTKQQKEWRIDRLRCVICNACVEACPVKCLYTRNVYFPSVFLRDDAVTLMRQAIPPGEKGTGAAAQGAGE